MNDIAESYVKLVLAVGQHDRDYVDAFYGQPSWLEEAKSARQPLDWIERTASSLLSRLNDSRISEAEEIVQLRHQYLTRQLQSLIARVEMLGGRTYAFDEEAKALYDVIPPSYSEDHFRNLLKDLGALLPGVSTVSQRYDAFKKDFIIPSEKLAVVFRAAIEEARNRTIKHVELPPDEHFTVEHVSGKSWSGYNWYKGNNHSLIQLNTDLPIYIDRAVDLAAHEGYPGHHVYNTLLESNLMRKRGWVEFSVYALFSPQSLIAEGSANYGIDVAFPGEDRVAFERTALFPLAGLDSSRAEVYYRIMELSAKLNYAGNEAARNYLNGTMTRNDAVHWLETYALMSPGRAAQRVRFIEQYRSYVINYNLGQDMVRRHVEAHGGTADQPARRWDVFKELISSPRLPSGLTQER